MISLAAIRRSTLAQNIATLYGVHVVTYVLPLVTLPFLARVLKPDGWGTVAFAQSFAQFLALLIEYGFNFSALREVAAHRDDPPFLAHVLTAVSLAKLLLAVLASLLGVLVAFFVPPLRSNPPLFWAAIAWAVSQGQSAAWFYQGLERFRFISAVEVTSNSVAVILILLVIRRPEQAWQVLALYAVTSFAATTYSLWAAIRRYGFQRPSLLSALLMLRLGLSTFIFRASVFFYTAGNAFILGLFVEPRTVGIYVAAERITKGFLGLFSPISQALYPRINALILHRRAQAALLARQALGIIMALAVLTSATIIIAAPPIVRIILGPKFGPSVLILRLLSLLIPIIAASNVLGIQWMLPLRCDRAFALIVIAAGICNFGLAYLLAPIFQATGMALAVITAETLVTVGCFLYLHARSLNPLSRNILSPSEEIVAA